MSNNTAINLLQQSLRITVGATTSLVETLQDPQKRQQTFSDLQNQVSQQARTWAEKGEITEAEAKQWVESWLEKQKSQTKNSRSNNTESASSSNINFTEAQREIEDLTAQILALKTELEQSRSQPH